MLKRTLHLFLSVALLLSVALSLLSCDRELAHAEIILTLPSEYREIDSDRFDVAATNGTASVGVARISFAAAVEQGISDTYSQLQFAEYFKLISGKDGEVYTYSGIPYFTYTDSTGGDEMFCTATFYRTPYAYFYVLYAVPASEERYYRDAFLEYAAGVKFKKDI